MPIPLAIPEVGSAEERNLRECIATNFVSSVGPFVSRFEAEVAALSGCREGVATCSGTAGLHLALRCVGVKSGDLVVVPTFTFIASANAVAHCGAIPWLFDCNDESWTLCPVQLGAALAERTQPTAAGLVHRTSGRRVAAILPVHALGQPADLEPLLEVAQRHQVPLVADAAAALGATYHGQPIGRGPTLSVFSFNGNKTITTGGGGMVVGDDLAVLGPVRHLCTTARTGREYDHDRVGYNYRMTNLQAAVGCAQLERLEHFLERKRAIRERYKEAFSDLPGVASFPTPAWSRSAHWLSGIVLPQGRAALLPSLIAGLEARGIEARSFWKPVHLQRP
ncbi:MAG: pyridoxal-5'-phosphate-dependent protein, partial [Deltaproteobacteria bacterium RIFOXYA12_FULL_61_11]